VAEKFYFAILRIEGTRVSRGLCAIAELLVQTVAQKKPCLGYRCWRVQLAFAHEYITLVVVDDVNKLTMSNILLLDITVFPVVYLFSKVMALFNDNWA